MGTEGQPHAELAAPAGAWSLEGYLEGLDAEAFGDEVTAGDEDTFWALVDTDLSQEQAEAIAHPPRAYPGVRHVLGIHWHPEFVPLDLIETRIDRLFPNRESELIIPTEHNVLRSWGKYAGAEVDCYCREFNRKVQLLIHLRSKRLKNAGTLRAMLDHTRRYRASQLHQFLDTLTEPKFEEALDGPALQTSASPSLVRFVRAHAQRLRRLVADHEHRITRHMLKNKLVRNYFDALRDRYDDRLIDRCQAFLKSVKRAVKADFSLEYFYEIEEILEEARSHDAGVIVPHPEQFWPILLTDYDFDGYEVWNPQSRQYTEFLVGVVHKLNRARSSKRPPTLVTMGDDCHMGEKIRDPRHQDRAKASREIGVQPGWEDLAIRKRLTLSGVDKPTVMSDYAHRLD